MSLSSSDRDVLIRLIGEDKISGVMAGVGKSSTAMGDKIKKAAKIGAAALAAVAVAAIKFGGDAVRAASEAEASQVKLEDAFKRFPKLADTNIESLRKYNEKLMEKTRFDDDAFASGQAILAQFDLTGQQLKDMTPLLADYAAKTGKELPDAAKILGKAFVGNTRALKDLGIDVELTGNKTKDYRIIQEALNDKVGGFAKKDGKTASGTAARLRNAFGELQEKVGNKLLPVLLKMGEWILKKGIPALKKFGEWIGPKIRKVVNFARDAIEKFREKLSGNGETMQKVRSIIGRLKEAWEKIEPVVRMLAEGAFKMIKNQMKLVGGVMTDIVIPAIDKGLEWFNKLLDGIKFVVDEIRKAWDKLPDFKISMPDLPNFNLPGFAKGVRGFGGGLAIVGEQGPELVNLPRGSDVIPNHKLPRGGMSAGGSSVVVQVSGFVGNERQLATEIQRVLRTAGVRFGGA